MVDSMPLEVCKASRGSRSKICREDFYSFPDSGFCASQQTCFYGYKLHAICSVRGVFKSLDSSKASVYDIHYLKDIKHQLSDCVPLVDKGYMSKTHQLDLFNTAEINLQTPVRINQKNDKRFPSIFRKSRKRIETLFSQLCDQFMIRRNYTISFSGFKSIVLLKVRVLTIIQVINKFNFNRNINNINNINNIKTNII